MGRTTKGLLTSKYAGFDLIRVGFFSTCIQLLFKYCKTGFEKFKVFLCIISLSSGPVIVSTRRTLGLAKRSWQTCVYVHRHHQGFRCDALSAHCHKALTVFFECVECSVDNELVFYHMLLSTWSALLL